MCGQIAAMLPLPMGIPQLLAGFALPLALAAPAGAEAVLRVGTSGDYPPFSLASPLTPDGIDGFDVVLARAYAEERGLAVEFVRFGWPRLAADLAAGRFDVAMSGVTVRPDRSLVGRFSVPVVESGAVVLVHEHSTASNLDELDQRRYRIGVNAGGHLERVARQQFARASLLFIPENGSVLQALLAQDVDAVVTDTLEAPLWAKQAGEVKRLGPFTRDRKAFLVGAERGELVADLDRWLLAREADGRMAALRRRWFGAASRQPVTTPLLALVAATDERLALMPWVVAAKRRDVRPIADPAREEKVIEAGLAAVVAAAEAGGRPAPPDEAVRAFFRAQIEAAKQVQLAAGRDEAFEPAEPVPDLETELRPALIRIGERIANLLVGLPEGLGEAQVAAACRDGLRSPWLGHRDAGALARAIFEVAAAARGSEDTPASTSAAIPRQKDEQHEEPSADHGRSPSHQ